MNEPMTPAIARSIVLALSANFGPWEDDRRDLWVGKIADLEDGEAGWIAAQLLIDNHQGARVRFAEFKTAYSGALRQLSERRSRERGLNRPERHFGIPAWAYVWAWARRYREPPEERSFPQQRPGIEEYDADQREQGNVLADPTHGRPHLTEEEYDALHSEWLAAGAPRHDPRSLVGA